MRLPVARSNPLVIGNPLDTSSFYDVSNFRALSATPEWVPEGIDGEIADYETWTPGMCYYGGFVFPDLMTEPFGGGDIAELYAKLAAEVYLGDELLYTGLEPFGSVFVPPDSSLTFRIVGQPYDPDRFQGTTVSAMAELWIYMDGWNTYF